MKELKDSIKKNWEKFVNFKWKRNFKSKKNKDKKKNNKKNKKKKRKN